MKWLRAVLCLAGKDIRNELRRREALASMLVFALLVIVLFHFAFDKMGEEAIGMAPGALWVTFAFSAMIGLSRSFSVEELNGCLRGLLLCPQDRSVIFAGKMLGNILCIGAVNTITLVLFVALFNLPLAAEILLLWVVMVLGIIGTAATGTVFSAMSVGTRLRQSLLPVLVLPVILPLIVFAMNVTTQIMTKPAGAAQSIVQGIVGIILFDIILTTAGLLTFEHVVVE